ncbi:MAG: T9SS C-terminal target domain-containing protein [Bacteroidetes bacterium]|nr:MAG: T9SS C-terminal target domain-containing protein [Bacteroidota bacterium]
MAYTSPQGVFQFPDVPVGYDFTVTPSYNDNPLNGVTTFDIVLLQRHILHVQLLDSPYKVIAGDVNNNGTLTVSDVVDLRKLVLHSVPNFPNNTSWRFVDKQWNFTDPMNPFDPAFPEVCNLNDLPTNQLPVDFVAVKVGDLNNTAITSSLHDGGVDERSARELPLRTPQQQFKAGQLIEVPVRASLDGLLGYQFTFEFDAAALQLEDLQPGELADMSNFGLSHLDEGVITTSWSQVQPVEQDGEVILFTLHFRATKDGKLSEALSLSSRYTAAESYNASGEIVKPILELVEPNGTLSTKRFELYQNVPNPFTGETIIGFELPEATQVTFQVYDVAGQMIKEVRGQFAAGYHEVSLAREDFNGRGVYFYRLETPEFTATKKMTMLE